MFALANEGWPSNAESGAKGEKIAERLLWGHPSIHPSGSQRFSLRTRGWHTKHIARTQSCNFSIHDAPRTKQKHGVAIKWITLLDPALLICRRPAPPDGYKGVELAMLFFPNFMARVIRHPASAAPTPRSIFINSCERIFHKYTILLVISHRNCIPIRRGILIAAEHTKREWMRRSPLSNPSKIPFAQNRSGRVSSHQHEVLYV